MRYPVFYLPSEVPGDYSDRARRGLMTPDQIEAELMANGLPPLATEPGPTKFDPMPEAWWTLPMAAAWVIWRTPRAVRHVWPAYRRAVRIWVGPLENDVLVDQTLGNAISGESKASRSETVTGYTLESLWELHLIDVLLPSTVNDPPDAVQLLTGEEARVVLWRKLESGDLVANGIAAGKMRRALIAETDWIDLEHYQRATWETDAVGRVIEDWPIFTGVRVNRARVVELWPVQDPVGTVAFAPRRIQRPDRHEAIRAAFDEIWPKDTPVGLMVKERDNRIVEWFKQKGLQPPSDRTIHRALNEAAKRMTDADNS